MSLNRIITLSSVRGNVLPENDCFDQIANVFRQQAVHSQIMQQIVERHTDLHKDQAEKHEKLEKRVSASENKFTAKFKVMEGRLARLEARNGLSPVRGSSSGSSNQEGASNVRPGSSTTNTGNGNESEMDPFRHFQELGNGRYQCPHCGNDYARHYILKHGDGSGCKKSRMN